MSFCRITGKARALPKSNFFPLIPPISPGDARRFCRITGKSYGLPSHHFIPVVLTSFGVRKKCRVTNVSAELGQTKHHYIPDISYGKRKHIVLLDYRYVYPIFDSNNETQKEFHEILNSKKTENENKFVYRVDEKRCNLVLPAAFEAMVRDGDVCDILFAKESDQIMLRLKKGNEGINVSVDLQDYNSNLDELYEGEGPREDVLIERERELDKEKKVRKISKCSRQQLKNITNIFENKDNAAQKEDDELMKKVGKKRANALKNVPKSVSKKEIQKMKNFMEHVAEQSSKKLNDLVKPLLESWDWDTYEHEAREIKQKQNIKSAVGKKMKILDVPPAKIKVKSRVGDIEKEMLKNTVGFECIPLVGNYKRPDFKPIVNDFKRLQSATPEMMKKLKNVVEIFQKADEEISSLLPIEEEIFDILQNISKGHKSELNGVPGCQIDIDDRRVFLAGEFIQNENGNEVFVPGQVILDKHGKPIFTAGLTIFDRETKNVNFISGMVMTSKDNQVHFQAGQIIGDEFCSGQTIYVNDSPQFIEGETIITPEGFRFVAGVYNEENVLTPGKFMKMPNGEEKFIPGQMTEIFVSGQNVLDEKTGEWKFMSGQTIVDETGEEIFVNGITVQTEEGSKFVAGVYNEDGVFVPGITKKITTGSGKKETKFFPGICIETKQGTQFCEGQMVQSEAHGEIFIAGKTEYKANGEAEFKIAESIDQISFQKPMPVGMVIDPHNLEVNEPSMAVFGHMVQTELGIEFYPEKIIEENLPEGKMIPGKLIKKGNETKFVPGVKGEDGTFIPGQVVNTPRGEEFVEGQLVETAFGPKFVPGKVITLKTGEMKFVPGVTDKNGRFVPGQIIDTKAGPTFIPGQICFTEEHGERFVPGQVVETERGEAVFVPGRIVETESGVTFIAGQVVETPDGIRFVAPDMKNEGDDLEFNLQGFQVTPEELALIKPRNNVSDNYINSFGEFSIDSVLMRQLSEAGMSIGRQVEAQGVDFVLQSTLNREIVENFCSKQNIDYETADSIFKMIKTLTDEHRGKINPEHLSVKILEMCMAMTPTTPLPSINHLEQVESQTAHQEQGENKGKKKTRKNGAAVQFSNDPTQAQTNLVNILSRVAMEILKNDVTFDVEKEGSSLVSHHVSNGQANEAAKSVYEIIANVLQDSIVNLNIEQLENTFASATMRELILEKLNNTINKVETMTKIEEMRQNLLSSAFGITSDIIGPRQNIAQTMNTLPPQIMLNDNDFVIEQFCDIIEDLDVSSAFSAMTKNNPQLMLNVFNAIQKASEVSNPNVSIKELIQKAIVASVNDENNRKIDEMLATDDVHQVENVLNEALLLAKVLGLTSEATTLLTALDKAAKTGEVSEIALDDAAKSIIRRVCIMKQLAEVDMDYKEALELLQQSPHRAVKDEIVRELVRKSGLISIQVPETKTVQTSNDVPLSLLDNELAMEDFMLRNNGSNSKAFLIIKDGIQCVVPREKSHDVLTGKCAYTVLDENGIRHFEPLHVMSALKMNTASQHHRFSIYANDSAIEEISKLRRSSCSPTYDTQARDFQFSNCDFVEQGDTATTTNSSDMGDHSDNGDFAEYFVEGSSYDVDQETGYRRPRRRKTKDDPTSNLDFKTTEMLRKRRGARADRKSKSPGTTDIFRTYNMVNDNPNALYISHAYVWHKKERKDQKSQR